MTFSIKQSFSDCSSCDLLDAPSCILETNCDNFSDVEVIFVAENPGKEEIKEEKPLVGKSGQVFRKYFNMYKLNKTKYILTNVVLCQTLNKDGTTGGATDETIERCKENCFKIIEQCENVKLIVLMGGDAGKAFGVLPKGAAITNFRGKSFRWKDREVFLTFHPSYILRQRSTSIEEKFDVDIRFVATKLGILNLGTSPKIEKLDKKGIHYYRVDEKFYSKDFKLLDVQFLHGANQVLYIFKDKDNKKVYHKTNDDYYCYKIPDRVPARKVMSYDELFQLRVPYKEKTALDPEVTYDGDFKLVNKHSNDYYLQKPDEENLDLKIMFIDIELYSDKKEFPNIEEAKEAVCLLSYHYEGKTITYVIDNKILLKDDKLQSINLSDEIVVFKTERDLLSSFIKKIKELDPDIITGWNVQWFDIPYLCNRAAKLGINKTLFSKFSEVNIDAEKGYADIFGLVVLDQLTLYRTFSPEKRENYRLGTVASIELNEDKLDTGMNFSQKYRDDVNAAIDYNRRDVTLIVGLEDKLKHIFLANELRKTCRCTFQSSLNAMGQLDSLVSSWLKSMGLASKNANVHQKEEAFEGAYVKEPNVGLHEMIVDFDFTSLYPSLIQTFNIGFNTFVMKFKEYTYGYDFVYQPDKLPEKFSVIIDPDLTAEEIEITKEQLFNKVKESNLICTINGCFFKPHEKEMSLYSNIVDHLLKSRKIVKNKMFEAIEAKDKFGEELYDTKQLVYKVLANAMYGVLGNAAYRFFNTDCARSITLSGQEFLKSSIIYADMFAESLRTSKEYVSPIRLAKKEVFGELDRVINHVITGDTDSVFLCLDSLIKGKDEDEKIEQVRRLCERVQNFLNKEIVDEIVKKHNVDIKNSRLNLKSELIIRRGLFLSKKHYSLHVISQEGKKIDKIVSKGLDTRRSDYPSYTKECLKELLDLILKSKKFSIFEIKKFIDSKDIEFFQRARHGEKTVARPASFTKDLAEYKKVPPNVSGMLNWNDLEYDTFNHGSKGYLFKLAGLNQEIASKEILDKYNKEFVSKNRKLDVICLPDEETNLPNYYNIDIKAMIKFAWKDRVALILTPLIGTNDKILTF